MIAPVLAVLLLVPGAPPKPQSLPADPSAWLYPTGAIPPVGLYASLPDVRDWGIDPATLDFEDITFETEDDYSARATAMTTTMDAYVTPVTALRDRLESLVTMMGLDPATEDFDTGLAPTGDELSLLAMADALGGNIASVFLYVRGFANLDYLGINLLISTVLLMGAWMIFLNILGAIVGLVDAIFRVAEWLMQAVDLLTGPLT